MKPHEVAKQLGVKPVTVRSWSDVFGEYLSPTGAGGDGAHRDFSEDDLRVLYFIKREKDNGRQAEQIKSTLVAMLPGDELRNLPLPTTKIEAEVSVVPAIMVDETRKALMRENAALQEQIAKLERQLTDERSDKESLLRQLADMNGQLQRALLMAELYEQGRLKPG